MRGKKGEPLVAGIPLGGINPLKGKWKERRGAVVLLTPLVFFWVEGSFLILVAQYKKAP